MRGKPFQRGRDPRRGSGKKGRSGRRPDAFHQACAGLADGPVLSKISEYLAREDASPTEPAWRWCAEYVTEHCYPKCSPVGSDLSVEVHQHDGTDAHALLLERLNLMSANLAAHPELVPPPTPPISPRVAPDRDQPGADTRSSANGSDASDSSGPTRVRWGIP